MIERKSYRPPANQTGEREVSKVWESGRKIEKKPLYSRLIHLSKTPKFEHLIDIFMTPLSAGNF